MVMFNSYVSHYQRVDGIIPPPSGHKKELGESSSVQPAPRLHHLLAGASKSKAFLVTPQVAEGLRDQTTRSSLHGETHPTEKAMAMALIFQQKIT